MMRKADIPPAPRRGHSSSRQTLKQKLDRTPGMRLFHEEEQGPEIVVHRTSSATRNFFGSLSGLKQLASKGSRSWLIRDASLPADLNGFDTESNASSFGSISGFVSRFGSAGDLAGLIGFEDLAVSGTPREAGPQNYNNVFLRSQFENGSRRNSLEGYTPRQRDCDEHAYEQRDDNIIAEQFAMEGVAMNTCTPDEVTSLCNNAIGRSDQGSTRNSPGSDEAEILEEGREFISASLTRAATIEKPDQCEQQENAAIKIQSAFRAWRIRSIQARKVAVVTIQKFFRGYCARKFFLEMQERALKLQASARMVRTRKQYRKIFYTVVTLQKLWLTVKSRRFKEQEIAAIRIQSVYRGWLARRMFIGKLRFIILLQANERRRQAQERYQDLRNTALLLQRTRRSTILQRLKSLQWRMAMQELKTLQELHGQQKLRESSAVMIQAAYRGLIARKLYEREIEFVVRLQARFRRNRQLKSFNRLRSAVSLIQGAWRLYKSQLQMENHHHCATKIQKVFRGSIVRRNFRREVTMVIVIQSWVRRKFLVKNYRELRASTLTIQQAWRNYHTHKLQLRRVRECAAVYIQAHYRGYVARKIYSAEVASLIKLQAHFRRKRAVVFFRRACQASLIIQQAWRAYKSRQVQLQNVVEAQAAIRIQSVYRGHLCRMDFRSDMSKVVWMQACIRRQQAEKGYRQLLHVQVQEAASLMIQTFFRGWSVRKKIKINLERVVLLQACARRMLARKHYQVMSEAASTIQQAWRSFKCHRRLLQGELETLAAVKIQSCYKGWICRKLFKTMLSRVVYTQACFRRTLVRKHYEELRRVVIILQRRWRRYEHLQLEVIIRAAVMIQSRWRSYKQQQFYQSVLQHRIDCATRIQCRWRSYKQQQFYQSLLQHRIDCARRIQRRWRGPKILQNLRLVRSSRQRAITLIQAHFRGKRVRMWLQRREHAVSCIESAYWSYAQRRPSKKVSPIHQQCRVCEQSAEALQSCVGACLVDDSYPPGNFPREDAWHGSNGNLDTFSPKSPPRVAGGINSSVYSNSREVHNCDREYSPSHCSVPVMEDWNDVAIDELDQCLDTCLAALPLSAASSRQRSLASSQQCSLTFDVVSSSSSMDHLETVTSTGSVIVPKIERTATPASLPLKKFEMQQDWVGVEEVYGSNASDVIQSGNEIKSAPHKFYPNPSRRLFVGEESAEVVEQGENPHVKGTSKDEERLQHFAEIFLTMRQISIQQQRAQSAPPFPPSHAPLSSRTPPQSPPIGPAAREGEVSSRRRSLKSPYSSAPLPPTPALSIDQSQVSSQRADVVLNMEELLKTLEQYCEGDSGGCVVVTEVDVERGQSWRVRKTGLNMTSTPTLGIKHLKLPDVNAVLIVLVAMVVYTRTVCREVFFGTKQSHRKN